MTWVGDLLNDYGQDLVPELLTENLPDLMNIAAPTLAKDTGGRYKKTASSNAYSNVPVAVTPIQRQIGRAHV